MTGAVAGAGVAMYRASQEEATYPVSHYIYETGMYTAVSASAGILLWGATPVYLLSECVGRGVYAYKCTIRDGNVVPYNGKRHASLTFVWTSKDKKKTTYSMNSDI